MYIYIDIFTCLFTSLSDPGPPSQNLRKFSRFCRVIFYNIKELWYV